ncbi:ATP-binding protein [Chloroflexi bacterium CFX2]|nr:ATP-binding protein [Chloroflexi bacterium CFX2]
MPACDPEKFVNRKKEIALVQRIISELASGRPFDPPERVFHFVGPSGIGKSCLLEICHQLAVQISNCIPIFIEFDDLRKSRGEFVENFLLRVDEQFSRYMKIQVQTKNGKTKSKYGSDLNLKIKRRGEGRIVVLFLDEINVVEKEKLNEIEEYLLDRLLHDNKFGVIITAGRIPPMFNTFDLRANPNNTFLLPVFDGETIGKQLEALRLGSAPVAEKVIELGGGVPGHTTKLAVHIVDGPPPQISNELQAVQSLLTDVKSDIEERFCFILEAICALQAFFPEDTVPLLRCHPVLGEGWDEIRIKALFPELRQVQIGPGGLINWDRERKSWAMDEPTRALFERELQMRDPELWRKLHCTAYRTYKRWGEEFNSEPFRDKAAYHQERLQSAGMDCEGLED